MIKTHDGFTLLEVIVTMAIVAMVLGTTFSLLAGSKRLAFKSVEDIGETLFLRSAINLAQLLEEPEYPQFPERLSQRIAFQAEDLLEKPDQQTMLMYFALEPYTFTDKERGVELTTIRLKKLDAVR